MLLWEMLIEHLADILDGHLTSDEIISLVERPRDKEYGDMAFPCFVLAKKLRKSPSIIATELEQKWSRNDLALPQAVNGYLNLTFDTSKLVETTLNAILKEGNEYGINSKGIGHKVVVDFCGVNVGKPMHVGHIRSTILGACLINVFRSCCYETHGINYIGDIGLHIGKLIYAVKTWGNYKSIKENPVKEFLRLYVKFCNEEKGSINIDNSPIDDEEDVIDSRIPSRMTNFEQFLEPTHTESISV